MKLKLEQNDSVTLLTVSEEISAENVPVLKAGLTKLFQSGKKSILLDLAALSASDLKSPSVAFDLASLPGWAKEAGFRLVVASKIPEVSLTPDRAGALAILTSPIADLLLEESSLRFALKDLSGKKATLEQKLNSLKTDDAKIKKLKNEKSRQLLLIRTLSRQVRKLLSHRKESLFGKPEASANRTLLAKTLRPILTEQKLLIEKKAGS
jgi:hypothetical protein